ncbi:MAG: hypothetical protein H0T93_12920 [Chloroflexia bacterium]|nr:hypothetical protein [Chloroflexia bacterium]
MNRIASPRPDQQAAVADAQTGTGVQPPRWRRWMMPFGIVAVALIAVATWWVSASVNGDARTVPIATLDTPDFHSLLVDPANPDRILFGSHAGIQESTDGGFTWADGTLRDTDAMQLTVSPNAPETIYVTGHDVFQISHDGGQTWQPQVHDLPGTDIHGFAQDPGDPRRLYASVVGKGTVTSGDGGATWQSLPDQPPGSGVLAAGLGVLYSGSGPDLMASDDGGRTWQTRSILSSGQVISLAVSSSEPQTIYAGTPNGIARSTDAGATWTPLGPDGVPVLAVAVSPTDSAQVLIVSNEGAVYRTDDGGETWRS